MPKLQQRSSEKIAEANIFPAHDCAPAELAEGTPAWLRHDLIGILGEAQVHSRVTDLIRYASDASPYRMFPKVVVTPRNVHDVSRIFAYARKKKLSVTIRAAGSSLSGQAQGDGILIDARRHWAGATVEEGGRRLRARPGTAIFRANAMLQPYGYRLGPDPASSGVATVGGVIANNSSGMCCGTVENSYRTLKAISFLLPSGTQINTAAANAEEMFAQKEPALVAGLLQIKREIEADIELAEKIRKKYSIKNTTGYHMAAFLDESTPLNIFHKLLVGSEGTLAFISEGVFETVLDNKFRLTSFLIFPDMHAATAAVAPFVKAGAAAVELCDRACLRAVEGKPGVPDRWKSLPPDATALLVEFREPTAESREGAWHRGNELLSSLPLLEDVEFTTDFHVAEQYWRVRHGLLASIGGARKSGTSLILEDLCFPAESLADGALDLQQLFSKHGYHGVVFGHASAGNLHFLITPSLNSKQDIARFDGFMQDVVSTVAGKYGGSLKAEHGTGRNVAPFVEEEWGSKLTEMMWRIKSLADQDNVLSPDVLLTRDKKAHLKNLHTMPSVEGEIDHCIECGYCEPVCPSRNITSTPRQRIVLRREMMRQPNGSAVAKALLREYRYDAIETCAGDGMCSLACPVDIDTGSLMKRFRQNLHSQMKEQIALKAAEKWSTVEMMARIALHVNGVVTSLPGGNLIAAGALGALRGIASKDLVPAWLPIIPSSASSEFPRTVRDSAAAVYFHACVNRIFGASEKQDSLTLPQAFVEVSARAGMPLWIPGDLHGTCCGTVWRSKGFRDGNRYMTNYVVEKMWEWSDHGRLPIVCDASSCTFGLKEIKHQLTPENIERHNLLRVIDSIDWAHDQLLPRLKVSHRARSVAVHPVCSAHHLQLGGKLNRLVHSLAERSVTPIQATCCGFAGDRGFLHPELTESATAEQMEELGDQEFDRYICSNRTCELGLKLASGHEYESFIFLLEEFTR